MKLNICIHMYDLEERTLKLAIDVRNFTKILPKAISNYEDAKQLIRSSGSIGANYIEANESLSRKDFNMRLKISRKEAKETIYWLRIILNANQNQEIAIACEALIKESIEIKNILSSIIIKTTSAG
ncbi:MAG: four helix bundle protein [Bacteroidales bacterium]|nr:four helix bundle protein [Bacteroidales bacterium]